MTGQKFVLFDFDGVIADTFALASTLAAHKCIHNTVEAYRTAFEGNINDTHENRMTDASLDHRTCRHDMDWWGEYERRSADAAAFAGIADVIRTLGRSYQLAIITSGNAKFIRPFLAHEGVADAFTDILDVDVHTQKTKKIEMIFEKYDVSAGDCVFVTDTLGDIREAAHHSVGSIGCSWGFHSHDRLEQGVPFRIVDRPDELVDAVRDYFARQAM